MTTTVRPPGWAGYVWLVLEKDLRIERQSGEIVTTTGFFAVLIVVLSSVAGAKPRALCELH